MIELVGDGKRPEERAVEKPDFKVQPENLAKLVESGYTAYSLAPLYSHVGVENYIPGRFAAEDDLKGHPGKIRGMILQFKHPVVARCGKWGLWLDVIETTSYVAFRDWLMSQFFVDREKQVVYSPLCCAASLLDPLAYAQGKREPTSLDIFAYTSTKGRLVPVDVAIDRSDAKPYVDLVIHPPDFNIVNLSKAVLEQTPK